MTGELSDVDVHYNRTDGVCVVCNRRFDTLTEIATGVGFIQICDGCGPKVAEVLNLV